jgi:antitoxin component YwqK of YwqJK toxin-antitoxin module
MAGTAALRSRHVTRWALLLFACVALSGCWRKDIGRSYYVSGKLRTEATVKNNVLDGPAVMYYENGRKMSEAGYRAGALNGKSISYYESGAKKAEAEYKDGVLHGTSISWSESATVLQTARFEDGRLVEAKDNTQKK